jgi:hypothetical protein
MNDSTLPWHITVLDEVGSTSDWLKQNAADLPSAPSSSPNHKPRAAVAATTAGSPRAARI